VKQVRGLLAKAEQYLARQRLINSYQDIYQKIKANSKTQAEFNLLMAKAREKFLKLASNENFLPDEFDKTYEYWIASIDLPNLQKKM
jgi:hypothetical protein